MPFGTQLLLLSFARGRAADGIDKLGFMLVHSGTNIRDSKSRIANPHISTKANHHSSSPKSKYAFWVG
jgi:hypothetical protein